MKGQDWSIIIRMTKIQVENLNEKPESGFELLDRLKKHLDELYYQLKLFPKLSSDDRSRLFERYRAADIIGIVSYLRKQEQSQDRLVQRMASKLTERSLQILRKIEVERDVQLRLGIHKDMPAGLQLQGEFRETLQKGLARLDLDPGVLRQINSEFGIVEIDEEDYSPTHDNPVSRKGLLQELFERVFSGPQIDRSALFDFLSQDSGAIVHFLDEKSKSEVPEEQVRALELTRLVPRKETIDLLGKILKRSQGEIRKKTDGILEWYRSQNRFQKYHRLIDSLRDQILRKRQLYSRKLKVERENEERKELYLEYFEMISEPNEEGRMALIKGLGAEGYSRNQRFIENVFERDHSVLIRSQILKDIARYRVEELYSVFEKAFLSQDEGLIYHAVLFVKEYSLCNVLEPLKRQKSKFKTFNEKFADQVVALLA